jgi:hypothetical protein
LHVSGIELELSLYTQILAIAIHSH